MAVTARPFREDQWRRVVNVAWGGRIALVDITTSNKADLKMRSIDPASDFVVRRDGLFYPDYPPDSGISWNVAPGPLPSEQYQQTGIYFVADQVIDGSEIELAPEQNAWFVYAQGTYFGVPAPGDPTYEGFIEAQSFWATHGPEALDPPYTDYDGRRQRTCASDTQLSFISEFHTKYSNAVVSGSKKKRYFLVNMSAQKEKIVAIVNDGEWVNEADFDQIAGEIDPCSPGALPPGAHHIQLPNNSGGFFLSQEYAIGTTVPIPDGASNVRVRMYGGGVKYNISGSFDAGLVPEPYTEGNPTPPTPIWDQTLSIPDGGAGVLARFDRNGFL